MKARKKKIWYDSQKSIGWHSPEKAKGNVEVVIQASQMTQVQSLAENSRHHLSGFMGHLLKGNPQ